MATYYWVGGSGTWDNSNTANWSSTSGGTGGAGFPGSADTAIIDNNSGSPTITTGAAISILSFQLAATSTSATVSLGNTFTTGTAGTTSITGGTFTTNNNTVTLRTTTISGTAARTLNLGSSTVNVGANLTISGSNFTLNAGTSTINMTQSTGATFAGNGLTFYNVVFTGTAGSSLISGSNTFNNLTFPGNTGTSGATGCRFTGNQTINGTLTVSASTSANRRFFIRSNTQGTQATLTAAAVSLTNVDFRDIIGAGAASWSGTSIGNATNNSGITFTTPKTVYWNSAAGGTWASTNVWATSAGGATSDANYPLPQDTAYIVDTGLNTSATVLTGGQRICNLDISGRTLAMTLGTASSGDVCGNLTLSSVVTFSGNGLDFYGTTTFTPNAATITASGIRTQPPATLNISGAITSTGLLTTLAGSTITLGGTSSFSVDILNYGTLTLNNNTLTGATCTLGSGSTTNFGTGKIVLTGSGGVLNGNSGQILTGSKRIELVYSGAAATQVSAQNPTEANCFNLYITAGTYSFSLSFNEYYGTLDFTGFAGTLTNTPCSVYGDLIISSGMTLSAGTSAITFAATSGTKTITTNGKTLDFPITFSGVGGTWQLADNLTQGSTRATSMQAGALDLNGKTLTVGTYFGTAGAGVKSLTFNGGTLVCPGSGLAFNKSGINFSTVAGTGTGKISMTSASAKTFAGDGIVYNCTLENAGAGALTITGANTFTTISNSVQPTSFLFTAGTTTTVTNFNVSGTSGNLVTIGSDTTASHTLSKSSGTVSVSYCTISYSTATGGATWQAYTTNGNVNGGNNSGWLFSEFTANGLFFGSNF